MNWSPHAPFLYFIILEHCAASEVPFGWILYFKFYKNMVISSPILILSEAKMVLEMKM